MILFRVDGNEAIGIGHVVRCISIADAAKKKEIDSIFICSKESSVRLIKEKGYMYEVLDTHYCEMMNELEKFIRLIKRYKPEVIFIDSYFLTTAYLLRLRDIISKKITIALIDDLREDILPCDILVNYAFDGEKANNEYKERYLKEKVNCPKLLLGIKYAPLREEFGKLHPRIINTEVHDVLLLSGGSDIEHFTYRFLKKLLSLRNMNLYSYHIVIGELNQDIFEIKKMAEEIENVQLYVNYDKMSDLMQKCDYAITAGGVTLLELCACGTPMGVYFCADNQVLSKKMCDYMGVSCIGDIRVNERFIDDVMFDIDKMRNEYKKRKEISIKQQNLIDGKGAMRIVDQLMNHSKNGGIVI